MAHYSIGEFAEKTGLSIPTLRYYEQEKLIYSHREENNRRYYDDSDIAWTQFIIRLKKTGMSIKNMQEYADLRYKGDSTIPQRLRLLFFQLDELHKQQTEINQHIDFLEWCSTRTSSRSQAPSRLRWVAAPSCRVGSTRRPARMKKTAV